MVATSLFLLPGFTFVLELIAFLLVLGFIAKYVLPPLRKAMDARAEHIRNSIQAAEDAKRDAEASAAKRRELLEGARQEARAIIDQANATADQLREEGRQKGQGEYERLLANARVDIEQERQRARDEVMEDVGALVLRAAEQVIGGALDAERHRALVLQAIAAAEDTATGDTPAGSSS
jgi:F-type H+-transporting ATPase subunit b